MGAPAEGTGRAHGAPAEGTGHADWAGGSEAPRELRAPVVGRGGRPLPRQPPVGRAARAVLPAMPRFQREVSPLGRARGLFREAQPDGALPAPRTRGGHGGCFASEVEFSKGYRHFASVITLAKCGIAVKVGMGPARTRSPAPRTMAPSPPHSPPRVRQRRADRVRHRHARSNHERPRSQRPSRPATPDKRADRPPAPPLVAFPSPAAASGQETAYG